jgi:hypothetical protein
LSMRRGLRQGPTLREDRRCVRAAAGPA